MNVKYYFSGDFLTSKLFKKLLPIIFSIFFLTALFISAGYKILELKERENNLKKSYNMLNATAFITHQKKVAAMEPENIQKLIEKYKLNIKPIPTTPIVIEISK